jgi:hypothetical protein
MNYDYKNDAIRARQVINKNNSMLRAKWKCCKALELLLLGQWTCPKYSSLHVVNCKRSTVLSS